jgi:hypothetical protein
MHGQKNIKYSLLLLRYCDLVNACFDQKKKTDGGGVEFQCPTCHKVTRVGKKGVHVLHDNIYIPIQSANRKAQQDEIYLSDDDRDDGGGGDDVDDDTNTPNTFDAANNRLVLCKF